MRRLPLWLFPLALFLAVGLTLRLIDLDADPPNHIAGMGKMGQDVLTDPHHINAAARDKVLFGDWSPFDYSRWVAFRVSLVSGVSWVVFALFGVSRWTANLSAVILNMIAGGLVIFALLGPGCRLERRAKLIAGVGGALLLGSSHALVVYGRLPFLENGLLALSAAVFLVTVRWGHNPTGAAIAGALVPLCALAGKLFGALIIAPALVTILLIPQQRLKRAVFFFVGAALALALWYGIVLGTEWRDYHAYLTEQAISLHGYPIGLTSPLKFLEQFVTYGAENGLTRPHYFLTVILLFGGVGLALRLRGVRFSAWDPVAVFLIVWTVISFLGLLPHNYRPLRYALFFLFPALALGAYSLGALWDKSANERRPISWVVYLVAFLCVWIVAEHYYIYVYGSYHKPIAWKTVWIALATTVALVALGLKLGRVKASWLKYPVLVFVAGELYMQGAWYHSMSANFTHDLKAASRDVSEMLAPGAVLSAPYAPTLTIDNTLREVIYSFGLAHDDTDLFTRFPITHLAIDLVNWQEAEKKFPSLGGSEVVWAWIFRDVSVRLTRLPDSIGGSHNVARTDFERGYVFQSAGQVDSALVYARAFASAHPDNRVGGKLLMTAWVNKGKYDSAITVGERLIRRHPTDFDAHMNVAIMLSFLGQQFHRQDLILRARRHTEDAVRLNPALEAYIRKRVATGIGQ